jgi:hypothetical protein
MLSVQKGLASLRINKTDKLSSRSVNKSGAFHRDRS